MLASRLTVSRHCTFPIASCPGTFIATLSVHPQQASLWRYSNVGMARERQLSLMGKDDFQQISLHTAL